MAKHFGLFGYKNPILGRGEIISEEARRSRGGGGDNSIRSFEDAQQRLLPQLSDLIEHYSDTPSHFKLQGNAFFSINIDSKFLAKSYFPGGVLANKKLNVAGTKYWLQLERDGVAFDNPTKGRCVFVKADIASIEKFTYDLKRAKFTKEEQKQLTRIDSIFLEPDSKLNIPNDFQQGAIELVFHPMTDSEWIECKEKISAIGFVKQFSVISDLELQFYDEDIRFVPATASRFLLEHLNNFNPLRFARALSRIKIPELTVLDKKEITETLGKARAKIDPLNFEIGVFDGGIDSRAGLSRWVVSEDLTPLPPDPAWVAHGTAVCSAAIFGPIKPQNAQNTHPKAKVRSFRIYPEEPVQGTNDFELYRIIPRITAAVEDAKNQHIKVFVLSSGPQFPIDDDEVNPLTAMIDKLCHEQDVLFAVAAGNDGDLDSPYDRIQPPADTVNGISVGAYSHDRNGACAKTTYSCNGPGRSGSQIKPDILGFGGSEHEPFYVRAASLPHTIALEGVCGTSFAAPFIGQSAAMLLHRVDNDAVLRPQTAKALLIHDAAMNGPKCDSTSWGISDDNTESILSCHDYESTIVFNGDIPFKTGVMLPIPFPGTYSDKGQVDIFWTIVYSSAVVPSAPDEYTLAGTEVYFIPNRYLHDFIKKDGKKVIGKQTVDIRDSALVSLLHKDGWVCTPNNKAKAYKKEIELRKEGKWDTVFRGYKRSNGSTLVDPYIHVHALARGDWNHIELTMGPGRLSYAAVITARAVSKKIDLYNQVRTRWPQLIPVRIRERVET